MDEDPIEITTRSPDLIAARLLEAAYTRGSVALFDEPVEGVAGPAGLISIKALRSRSRNHLGPTDRSLKQIVTEAAYL